MKVWSEKVRRVFSFFLASIGFWVGLGWLMAWQECFVVRTQGLQINIYEFVLLYEIREDFTLALLTPPVFFFVRRFAIGLDKPLRGVIAYVLGFAPFLASYLSIRWILTLIWKAPLAKFVPGGSVLGLVSVTFAELITAYTAIVIAAHAYEYFVRGRAQEVEQHELQQALAASELQALKSQIHPHFLFNTLHGISSLVDTDRTRAKAMIIKLSNLLRTALQHGSCDLISLQEEVKFLESYLDLEKMRLGSRLEVRWKIDVDDLSVLVPQLILQPLVENAILHGIACCREGGWIEIASRRVDGTIEIRIRNSVGEKRHEGMGLGLTNTKARLKHLYSEEGAFSFEINELHIAVATLHFPAFISHQQVSTELRTGTQG
jgi:two-component system, LytTR family, sensor kinase